MTLTTGDRAPGFRLSLLKDSTPGSVPSLTANESLEDLMKTGSAVLIFVKETCPTCQFSFRFLDRLHSRRGSSITQVRIIAQEDSEGGRRIVDKFEVTTPILLDEEPFAVSEEYQINYVPTVFFINPQGIIENHFESFDKLELESIFKKLTAQDAQKGLALFDPEEQVPVFRPG